VGRKTVLVAVILAAVLAWFGLGLDQHLTFEAIRDRQEDLQRYYQTEPFTLLGLYLLAYIIMAALSLPGAALLTLLGGAVFGLFAGTLVVSFASTIGATLAMLLSRTLFHDAVAKRFKGSLDKINAGIERDGAFYLFALRLVPVFPFFVINLAMGLTKIKARRFYWVSQLGMLPGTLVYVNAGTQLAQLESTAGILSPGLIGAFALLALFPWIARKLLERIRNRHVYRGWKKPKHFDRNLIVIGGGAAGLVTSYIAAAVKANVSLIEDNKMGGDCLNTGCVPSKALIRSAHTAHQIRHADQVGLQVGKPEVDFPAVMKRIQRVIGDIEPHDSVDRYTALGVDCIKGRAVLTTPWSVEVDGRPLTARHIVIATGGRPKVPLIPGLSHAGYLTSENLWQLQTQPKHLLVLGGGPIGCELAQAFRRLGSEVTIVEFMDRLLPRDDEDVGAAVQARFEEEGIRIITGHRAIGVVTEGDQRILECAPAGKDGASTKVSGDQILVAVGREANTENLGLDVLNIPLRRDGTIETNEYLQTRLPNIYACGDVTGPYQFTHVAGHQAWYAAVNALFGFLWKFQVDYSVIPFVVFSDPQVARVGLNEQEAKQQGVSYEITRYGIDDLDRAIAEDEAHGFIKVLTVPGKDKILGVTIVGAHAGDMIAEYVLAMRHGLGLNKILGTIHAYPTFMEANKYVAGEWKRAHAPQGLLEWVRKFHQWRLK
jgi:dihydrolipoamide dehydrogenase